MQPVGADATSTELIDQLQDSLASLTGHLGGQWTGKNGTPFTADRDYRKYPAVPCSANGDYEDDSAGLHFSHTLLGPGADDPAAQVDRARDWAQQHGWSEVSSGQGSQPEQGDVFATFTGEGLPTLSVNSSTERSMVTSTSPCSTDSTVRTHDDERPRWTSPNDRFSTPSESPSPSSTKLGVSG